MKNIVFDMDGVILDTENCYMVSWSKVAKKHNVKNFEEVILKCMGTNAQKTKEIVLDAYGKDFDYDSFFQEASNYFNELYGKNIPVKKGVYELLDYLKKNNYKIALASSTEKSIVIEELTNAKVVDYFDVLVTGDMVSKSKPEPDIYLLACSLLNESPENCYAIEDSYNGIRSAYNANMKAIMVPDLVKPDEEMKEKSYVICSDLIKVKEFLEKTEL